MVVWKWSIIVVTLTSVSGEVQADFPLVGRESAVRTDGPKSNQSEIEHGSSGVDEVLTNPLDELITQTGDWKESSVDSVQTDTLAEPINQTGREYSSVVDTTKNDASFESRENAIHDVSKNYSAQQLFHQLVELFSIPHSHLGPVFERPKWSNTGAKNPSQVPIGFHDPFQPVKDALYQYTEQITKQEIEQGGPKKEIPSTLADLDTLSDDEIRDLSYHYIPMEEHAMFMYREMLEDMKNPFVDRKSRARINEFWKWFKLSYLPANLDHIDVKALADANWFGIRKLHDTLNANPDEDFEEDQGFFERLSAYFNIG